MWWLLLASIVGAIVLLYLLLLLLLVWQARRHSHMVSARDVLRLLPDLIRLLRRLAADPTLPRGVRVRLYLLLAYLLTPFDLIPDFIPVIGIADDVIIVAIGLRSVAHRAGHDAIDRHWPGTPQGLEAIRRLSGTWNRSPTG